MNPQRREKRRRLVEREIAAAAMRLFGERGFEAVTVEDIAEDVGISGRTFFRYYATKEEVVLQYQRRIQERLVDALADRPPEEGVFTALRAAYLATSHVAPEDRENVLLTNRFLSQSRALRVRIEGERTAEASPVIAILAERAGLDRTDLRIETLAVAVASAAGFAFQRWLELGGHGDPAERIGLALDLLGDGARRLDGFRRTDERSSQPKA